MSETGNGYLSMRYLHGIAIWMAALFAAIATGRIVALLSGANARSHVTIGTGTAAVVGVASMLLSVFVVYLLTRRQPRLTLAPWVAPGDLAAGDYIACLQMRREVLDWRLNIDEPRLCSQYLIACTSWSMCSGSGSKCSSGEDAPAEAQTLIRVRTLEAEANGLPLVHRNGMDNCPFRFASVSARSVPAGRVAPNSSAIGTTPR